MLAVRLLQRLDLPVDDIKNEYVLTILKNGLLQLFHSIDELKVIITELLELLLVLNLLLLNVFE